MTLDGMMTMAKADRYTEEGQKIIQDARRIYKVDEISETTGLQKQADGSWAPPKAGAPGAKNTEKAVGQDAEKYMSKMKSEGWKNSGFDPAPGGRSFGVFSNGDKKIKVGVNAEGKIESIEEVKNTDNTTGKDFKEGQRIPNAGAIGQTYRHRERQYLAAHKKEAEANPKNVTERRSVLADLVANARAQAQMFEAVNDMSEGEGNEWEINNHVAEELEKLRKEEKELQSKLNGLEKKNAAGSIPKKDVAAEQTARNKAMTEAENESLQRSIQKREAAIKNAKNDDQRDRAEGALAEFKNATSDVSKKTAAGKYDDAIRDTAGDSTALEDVARDLIDARNFAYPDKNYAEAVEETKKVLEKRYKDLESDATGDSAPLTGDTKIRVKK